jgi:hypothetical protein
MIINYNVYFRNHSLIFCIDKDAPDDYINRWKKIKFHCEECNNKYIIEKMKTYCKLEQNKNIPCLEREEGGIGGNNNIINSLLEQTPHGGVFQ